MTADPHIETTGVWLDAQHIGPIQSALRVVRESLDEPSRHFSREVQMKAAKEVDAALAALDQWLAPTTPPPVDATQLREALAEYAHEAWSGWMKYLFEKCEIRWAEPPAQSYAKPERVLIMPAWAVERWTRQAKTSYAELPESEKESDRQEADRMLAIMQHIATPQPMPTTVDDMPMHHSLPAHELVELRNASIKYFYLRVCRLAEKNMAHTGTVSGAHWNAMQQVLAQMHIEVDEQGQNEQQSNS